MSIYINGILSGVAQYPAEDNFMQKHPVDILIGSNASAIDLYTIRIYDSALSSFQLLDNFIGDMDDFDRKLAAFERNRIYDDYGNIRYEAILQNLPCLTVTGTLPAYKGDKKTVSAVYEDRGAPATASRLRASRSTCREHRRSIIRGKTLSFPLKKALR